MTNIVSRERPNYTLLTDESTVLKKTVRLPSLSSKNITAATILKAAWSLVLAQTSATSDVTFGNIVSGRNAVVPGLASVVGPCLNINPVRIKLQTGWTALDLLQNVQSQQVANMPYESLGFREIVQHCTDWPDWTSFSSVLQHQNFERSQELQLGNINYHVGAAGVQGDLADISIVSVPRNGDDVEITISFAQHGAVSSAFAERLLNMLCTTAGNISRKPAMKLPSPSQLQRMPRQTADEIRRVSEDSSSTVLDVLTESEMLELSNTVSHAWQLVLPKLQGKPAALSSKSSFFDLGGDVVGLAQVAALLESDGFEVRLEDLIDHSILSRQIALLAPQKSQSSSNMSSSSSEDMKMVHHVEVRQVPERRNIWRKSVGVARKFIGRGKVQQVF